MLLSGSHLAAECPDLVGATPDGAALTKEATYLAVGGRAVPVSDPWQPVRPHQGTAVLAWRLAQQEPAKDTTNQAIVTRRAIGAGSVTAVYGPLFRDYFLGHYPLLRRFIAEVVEGLGIPWEITVQAPPRLEVIARRKDAALVVNLINRGAGETLSPHRVIVEELPPVTDVVLRIRRDAAPTSVAVEPDGAAARWGYADGVATVEIPQVEIHCAIVVR